MAKRPSFAERLSTFCDENKVIGGPKCLGCQLPPDVREAVRGEHAKGSSLSLIARALRAEGFRLTEGALQNHFRNHEQR